MIENVLGSLKNDTLRRISVSVGARVGIRKLDRVMSIRDQMQVLGGLQRRYQKHNRLVVTAIDAGISNFAYCTFSFGGRSSKSEPQRPLLLGWNKLQLEEKFVGRSNKLALNPHNFALLSEYISDYMLSLPHNTDLFTIERQRTRTVSSKSVLEPILRSNILEYLLFSKLYSHGKNKDYSVLSSDPRRMVNYWIHSAPIGPKITERLNEKMSKKLRISLVQDMLQKAINNHPDRLIDLSEAFRETLTSINAESLKLHELVAGDNETMGAKKDDDLADSFLHGLIWFEYLRNYKSLLKRIENGCVNNIERQYLLQ